MNRSLLALGVASVVAVLGFSGGAQAVDVTRDYLSHGTANCQTALPVFDGNVRKRPMAVANEGAGIAFITCDSESIHTSAAIFSEVRVYLRNRAGAADVTVNCTLVNGVFTASSSFPKTSVAIPVGSLNFIAWSAAADNGGNKFHGPATSCGLPPGVDISAVRFTYLEGVGS